MNINYIEYAGHKIETQKNTPVPIAIEILSTFYPEVKYLEWYIDKKVLHFKELENIKARGESFVDIFNKIFIVKNSSRPENFTYHTNPNTERTSYQSTIPEAGDTGGYFIDGLASMGNSPGSSMSGQINQPTAEIYDQSKANTIAPYTYANWSVTEADQFRMNAADPPYVNGDYINRWLKQNRPDVPLNGYGDTIKLMSDYFGVAAVAGLGVWAKETQFGLGACGGRYNLGCKMWTESSPYPKIWTKDRYWIDPPSFEVAIADWNKHTRYRYIEQGLVTYRDFLNTYSPTFENDHAGFKDKFWGVFKSFGYDVRDKATKNNYSSQNDDVNAPDFLSKVQALATGGADGQAVMQPGGSIFKAFPTIPSKSQVNYGWNGYPGHTGIDIIYLDNSSDIFAVDDGTVTATQTTCVVGDRLCGSGWGNHVRIKHPNGYSTLYAHLTTLNVNQGQAVKAGQKIGIMGNTGRSDGKHLHFEVWNSSDNKINAETVMTFTGYKRM